MSSLNYKEIIEEIKEITKNLTIVEGVVDVYYHKNHDFYEIKDASNCFWINVGKAPEEEIKECLEDGYYEKNQEGLDLEGQYHFDAVLKYDYYDNEYSRGYWCIEYIEFHFEQTFLQREREDKLFKLLDDDLDIFP